MSASEYRVGDLVRLKSGGPIMVVLAVAGCIPDDLDAVLCRWHIADGSTHDQFQDHRMVRRVSDSEAAQETSYWKPVVIRARPAVLEETRET